MGCNKKSVSKWATLFMLVLLIIISVLVFVVIPYIIEDSVIENTILNSRTSEQFERFEKLPFALNFSVRFFNIENPDDIMAGAKPNVKEMGKIVYGEVLEKLNLTWQENNLLRYDWKRTFSFQPEYSNVTESTIVTTINVPLVVIYQIFENISLQLGFLGTWLMFFIESGVPGAFQMEADTVFLERPIGELTMNGYKFCDPKQDMGFSSKAICLLLRNVDISETIVVEDGEPISFSFFKYKHGITKGAFEVESGINDINRLGQIERWGDSKRLPQWNEEGTCNDIHGTDSTIYAPFNNKGSEFTVLNTDVCRTIKLGYKEETEYHGVAGYQSDIKMSNLDWTLEENKCYCIKKVRTLDGTKECLPNNYMDMTNCVGAPLVLSYPHFLWTPGEYADSVTGLEPNEQDHKIFIKMEPNTGTPLEGHKRVQFNIVLRQYFKSKVSVTRHVSSAMLPIFWIDESAEIPDDLVQLIRDQYVTPVEIVSIVTWVLMSVVSVALLVCLSFYIYIRN